MNLQEPQRNRNATATFVNLIRTSTVPASRESSDINKIGKLNVDLRGSQDVCAL